MGTRINQTGGCCGDTDARLLYEKCIFDHLGEAISIRPAPQAKPGHQEAVFRDCFFGSGDVTRHRVTIDRCTFARNTHVVASVACDVTDSVASATFKVTSAENAGVIHIRDSQFSKLELGAAEVALANVQARRLELCRGLKATVTQGHFDQVSVYVCDVAETELEGEILRVKLDGVRLGSRNNTAKSSPRVQIKSPTLQNLSLIDIEDLTLELPKQKQIDTLDLVRASFTLQKTRITINTIQSGSSTWIGNGSDISIRDGAFFTDTPSLRNLTLKALPGASLDLRGPIECQRVTFVLAEGSSLHISDSVTLGPGCSVVLKSPSAILLGPPRSPQELPIRKAEEKPSEGFLLLDPDTTFVNVTLPNGLTLG